MHSFLVESHDAPKTKFNKKQENVKTEIPKVYELIFLIIFYRLGAQVPHYNLELHNTQQ